MSSGTRPLLRVPLALAAASQMLMYFTAPPAGPGAANCSAVNCGLHGSPSNTSACGCVCATGWYTDPAQVREACKLCCGLYASGGTCPIVVRSQQVHLLQDVFSIRYCSLQQSQVNALYNPNTNPGSSKCALR